MLFRTLSARSMKSGRVRAYDCDSWEVGKNAKDLSIRMRRHCILQPLDVFSSYGSLEGPLAPIHTHLIGSKDQRLWCDEADHIFFKVLTHAW